MRITAIWLLTGLHFILQVMITTFLHSFMKNNSHFINTILVIMKNIINKTLVSLVTAFLSSVFIISPVLAQTEVMAWGNLTGIRVDGQLMEFESSLRLVNPDWTKIAAFTTLIKKIL
jgi:hypothetical protein